MQEVDPAVLASVADAGPPGLEVVVAGAGGDFEEALLPRRPDLEVVGLGLAESHVAGAEEDDPVGQLEALEHVLGVLDQQLQLLARALGLDELDQLHLVELVHPDVAAGVLAGRAGLAAEIGGPGDVLQRQF